MNDIKKEILVEVKGKTDNFENAIKRARLEKDKLIASMNNAKVDMKSINNFDKQFETKLRKSFGSLGRATGRSFVKGINDEIGLNGPEKKINENMNKVIRNSTHGKTFGGIFMKGMGNQIKSGMKDIENIFNNMFKWGYRGIMTGGVAAMVGGSAVNKSNQLSLAGGSFQALADLPADKYKAFTIKVKELSNELGISQTKIMETGKDLASMGVDFSNLEDVKKIMKELIQYNAVLGGEEKQSLAETAKNVVGSLSQKTQTNILNRLENLQKTTKVSAGSDVLVSQAGSTLFNLAKATKVKDAEVLGLFSSLVGKSGNEFEAATQTDQLMKSFIEVTPEAMQGYKNIGINKGPELIIKEKGLIGYLEELKSKLGTKGSTTGKMQEEIDKIDPFLGSKTEINPETKATKYSKKYEEFLKERNKKVESIIKKYASDKAFERDPFLQNLSEIFGNINAVRAVLGVINDLDVLKANTKAISNDKPTLEPAFQKISDTQGFGWQKAMVRLDNFFITFGEHLSGPVLKSVKSLSDWFDKNQAKIMKFVDEGLKLALDKFKQFFDYMTSEDGINKIKQVTKVLKFFFDSLVAGFKFISNYVLPPIQWIGDKMDGFKKTLIDLGVPMDKNSSKFETLFGLILLFQNSILTLGGTLFATHKLITGFGTGGGVGATAASTVAGVGGGIAVSGIVGTGVAAAGVGYVGYTATKLKKQEEEVAATTSDAYSNVSKAIKANNGLKLQTMKTAMEAELRELEAKQKNIYNLNKQSELKKIQELKSKLNNPEFIASVETEKKQNEINSKAYKEAKAIETEEMKIKIARQTALKKYGIVPAMSKKINNSNDLNAKTILNAKTSINSDLYGSGGFKDTGFTTADRIFLKNINQLKSDNNKKSNTTINVKGSVLTEKSITKTVNSNLNKETNRVRATSNQNKRY